MAAVDVIWTSGTNVTITGNDVEKTSGAANTADAGAISTQAIEGSGGYVEFKPNQANKLMNIGLGNNTSVDPDLTPYAFRCNEAGGLEFRELGVYKGETTYAANDLLRLLVSGVAVKYFKNGVEVYSSLTPVTLPIKMDAGFSDLNGKIVDAVIETGGETFRLRWTRGA